jgi:acyl phosphate:glycerol-3-phosphate acyltransferase
VQPQAWLDAALVLGAYLAGSLPMGVIVARLTRARDPRTVGSGRTGGTNAWRAMGLWRGILVGVLDIAKGALPVLIATLLGSSPIVRALAGVAAILGAWASVFLRFHGGRGVATGIGAMAVIQPLVIVFGAPVFFGVIGVTRYVSLGSLVGSAFAAALLIPCVALGLNPPTDLIFAAGGLAIVWFAHRDNIGRLLRGEERKIEFSSSPGEAEGRETAPPP